MFDGLMSRCSTPERCAVSTALAILIPIRSTSCTASGSALYRWLSVDEQYSITRYGLPSADTLAWNTVRIDGCELSCAIRLASAWNSWRTWSFTTSASSTLTATWRLGMFCSNRNTSAKPPEPSTRR